MDRVRVVARQILAGNPCAAGPEPVATNALLGKAGPAADQGPAVEHGPGAGLITDPEQWSKKPIDAPKQNLIKLDDVAKQDFGNGSSYQQIVGDAEGSTPVRFGVQVCPSGYATPSHSHPYMEIINVLEGEGYCWVEGVEGRMEMKPGVTLALPTKLRHGFGSTGPVPLKISGTHANPQRVVDLEKSLIKPEHVELKPLEPWVKTAYIKHDEVPDEHFPNGATYKTLAVQGDGDSPTAVRIGVQTSPPGYATGTYSHPYMELVSVLEGTGVAWMEGVEGIQEIRPGTTLSVPPNCKHGFRNTGTGPLKTYGIQASGVRITAFHPEVPEPGREPATVR